MMPIKLRYRIPVPYFLKHLFTDSSDEDVAVPDDPEAPIILRRKRYVRQKDRLVPDPAPIVCYNRYR